MDAIVPMETVKGRIYLIRGQKVLLSNDLASLYEVEPRVLTQAVKGIWTGFLMISCFSLQIRSL